MIFIEEDGEHEEGGDGKRQEGENEASLKYAQAKRSHIRCGCAKLLWQSRNKVNWGQPPNHKEREAIECSVGLWRPNKGTIHSPSQR